EKLRNEIAPRHPMLRSANIVHPRAAEKAQVAGTPIFFVRRALWRRGIKSPFDVAAVLAGSITRRPRDRSAWSRRGVDCAQAIARTTPRRPGAVKGAKCRTACLREVQRPPG